MQGKQFKSWKKKSAAVFQQYKQLVTTQTSHWCAKHETIKQTLAPGTKKDQFRETNVGI